MFIQMSFDAEDFQQEMKAMAWLKGSFVSAFGMEELWTIDPETKEATGLEHNSGKYGHITQSSST